MDGPVNWSAAACAGIAAGILATLVQIILWFALTDSLPGILFRDAHLAAAIVMGSGVLSRPASLDWRVMVVATLLHFALSIGYALILSRLIAGLRTPASIAIGAFFGLCLYVVNMYGFTLVFPWFEAARDWITIVTHVAFGIVAACFYRVLAQKQRAPRCGK